MKLTDDIYRVGMTISGIASGIGGLFAIPGVQPLGIPEAAGAVLALIAGIATVVASVIKANWSTP